MKPACERYQLDLVRYELRRPDGVKVKLERQPMELLIFLAGGTGLLVPRQEVAATLWPGGISVDSEPAINNAVRKIRAALHDSTDHPLHLETVVGKGYRFIGDLEVIDGRPPVENGPPAVAALVTTAPQRPKSRPPRIFLVLSAAAILIVVGLAGRA